MGVDSAVEAVVGELPMLRRTAGKMVYELRPSVEWNKGKAVEWLLEQMNKEIDEPVLPIYIGDDVTDEDAFAVVVELGGIGILVSESATKDSTTANYALRNPNEVRQFLEYFASGGSSTRRELDLEPELQQTQPESDVVLLPPPVGYSPITSRSRRTV